jgi:spore coat protein U-like protein
MKSHRNVLKAVAAAVLATLSTGVAVADTTTANVTASITIQGICRFTGAVSLPFGTVDPSSVAGNLTSSAAVSYRCTNGTTPSSLAQSDTSGNLTDGTNNIAFSVNDLSTNTLLGGQGFGSAVTPRSAGTITATILQAAAQNAPAGTYNNTAAPIVLTLTY